MGSSSQHTPASLKYLAGYALGYAAYRRCLRVRWFRFGDRNLQLQILTSHESENHIFLRTKLIEELKAVKRWWDGDDSVQGVKHLPLLLQQEVGKTFCDILQTDLLVDENIISSALYKLLLELLFGYEAGKRYPDHWLELNVPKLNYKALDAFENILTSLKPFNCEVLNLRCKRNRKSSEKEFLEYSRILKTILQNAPKIRAILDISKTSVYPSIIYATQLEVLTFLELPEEFLFQVFFKNQSQESVIDKFRRKKEIGITFPKLKIVGLPFAFDIEGHKLFLQVLIHCYPQIHTLYYDDLKSVSCELLMSDDIEKLFKNVDRTACKLKSIAFTDIQQDTKYLQGIKNMCPLLSHMVINDNQNPDACTKEEIDNVLGKFNINCLTIKLNWEYMVFPLDISCASTLRVLHLELLDSFNTKDNNTLCELINTCENLECLKILFMSDYGESHGVHGDLIPSISEKRMKIMTRLTTLSCYGQFGIEEFVKHKTLLNWLIKCSPNLNSLEISRRDIPVVSHLAESGKLDALESLTLIGEDYCLSWVGDLTRYPIIPLINILPSLRTLVLYMNPKTCAELKRTFNKTSLKIINGTSEFLKDTTYNLLVRMDPGLTESDLLEQFYFHDL